MKLSDSHKGIAQIHMAVFLFGFAGLFGKFLSCDPLYIVFGRTFFAAIALFTYTRVAANHPLSLFTKHEKNTWQFFYFILQGILLAIHWWTFFVSIQVSSVAVGLVCFSSFPLFVTFMEPFFFNERLKKRNIATAIAVFAGIILVIPEFTFENNVTKGAFYGVVSGFTFALLAIVNRKNAMTNDSIVVAFYQNVFAALFLMIPLIFVKTPWPGPSDLPNLLFLGVVCTALSHSLFISALGHIKAQTAAVIAGLEPVYGIVLAFFMINEIPEFRTLFGGLIIITTTIIAGFLSEKYHE